MATRSWGSSQGFEGLLEIVCIEGGFISKLEAQEMSRIVDETKADLAKSGLKCRIKLSQMEYYDFLQAYD